jgi:uncharacterized membrane protein YcaP (DUF421 family)
VLTKIMGKRQISQLSLFDYINGITIGSVAAELATAPDGGAVRPLIALLVYSAAAVGIALLSNKSLAMRRLFEGRPMTLFDNGRLYLENLKKVKIDINEFLASLRQEGYFDLADVQTAIMENNGMLSVLPKSSAKPATPEDIGIQPPQDKVVANVVIDGRIMPDILKQTGNDEQWLRRRLSESGVSLEECLIGTVDGDNEFAAYPEADRQDQLRNPFI